nr:Gfo/Idh/MocA family oxidoreductase [Enterococcus sp. 665A]
MMKIIFFGLGSIGKRHLENLRAYGKKNDLKLDITSFKNTELQTSEELIDMKYIRSFSELEKEYDVAFITNPTYKHKETLDVIAKKTKHIFLEKPAFIRSEKIEEIGIEYSNVYVAAPLRYKKIMKYIKSIIPDMHIFSVEVICSTYLPDWRSGDYRKQYSALKKMGGGVELDCIHEIDYVANLFGFPDKVIKYMGKYSDLELDSNDLALYIFIYSNKLINIHLDYFGKNPKRKLKLYTNEGNIEVDFLANKVFKNSRIFATFEEDSNQMYVEELNYFMDVVINDKENWNDLRYANKVLELAEEK